MLWEILLATLAKVSSALHLEGQYVLMCPTSAKGLASTERLSLTQALLKFSRIKFKVQPHDNLVLAASIVDFLRCKSWPSRQINQKFGSVDG